MKSKLKGATELITKDLGNIYKILDKLEQRIATLEKVLASHAKCIGEMRDNGGGRIWDYFCNHNCLMDYMTKHTQAVISIAPRREALETPIKVEKEKYESYRYKYNDNGSYREPYQATRTIIKKGE